MNNQSEQHSIKDQVAAAISAGRVKMRPKWYFALRASLALTGGFLIGLVLLFLVSLIIFTLRQTGTGFAPAFGMRGWFIFLRSLPWALIVLSLIFIGLLELFTRQYAFAYRRPLLYSACGIIVLVVGGGFIIAGTSLHRDVSRYVRLHHVPFGERVYLGIRQREFQNVYPGIILATTTDGVLLHSRRGDILRIMMAPETRLPIDRMFSLNQPAIIFGESITSGTIRAFGVRLIEGE